MISALPACALRSLRSCTTIASLCRTCYVLHLFRYRCNNLSDSVHFPENPLQARKQYRQVPLQKCLNVEQIAWHNSEFFFAGMGARALFHWSDSHLGWSSARVVNLKAKLLGGEPWHQCCIFLSSTHILILQDGSCKVVLPPNSEHQ